MAVLDTIKVREQAERHRPWPRVIVGDEGWRQAIELLAGGRCTMLGLWGDAAAVHMALLNETSIDIAVLSYICGDGTYPSVGARHPPAIRLERAIRDLYGLDAIGAPDTRTWLDLGFWDVRHPLGNRTAARKPEPYAFLPAEGEGLHQIPVGPVHAGIIEPGHFRFTANGEHLVRLEQRLGYVHKGIESLMHGATLDATAKLASRTSGDSTVAYAYAFAQATEAALRAGAPSRALYLRALMAELERLANHLGDIGAICNDASFALMHAQTGILRERCLRAAKACFGHRLMMDVIVPGGVARDMAHQTVRMRLPDQGFMNTRGQTTIGELREGSRERCFARHLARALPPAQPAQRFIHLEPLDQPCGRGQSEHSLGGKCSRQCVPVRKRAARQSAPGLHEGLDAHHLEHGDQLLVPIRQRPKLVLEPREKLALNTGPSV